jgi:hypothetical protein
MNTLYIVEFRRMEERTDNFTPGDNFTPRGETSPLGSKFAKRGEVKNGPQGDQIRR